MKKYFLALFVITSIVVGYFAVTIFSNREGDLIRDNSTNNKTGDVKEEKTSTIPKTVSDQNNTDNAPLDTKKDNAEGSQEDPSEENSFYVHVTPTDCLSECRPYKYDEKELKYCQNICGFSDTSTDNSECDKKKDLEKDYCYKNQAIGKKDVSTCDKISDANIKKTCKARIQEDILEQM